MRFVLVLLLAFGGLSTAHAQRYERVWADEFDTYDTNVWVAWFGTAFNNELQFYTRRSNNIEVRDGMLYLWAQNESFGGRQFTSGRLESRGPAAVSHHRGRFEARAKMPRAVTDGLWPAIWMLPATNVHGSWPRSGEIDIMEWRSDLPRRVYGTIHFQRNGQRVWNGQTRDLPIRLDDDFNVYAVEWTDTHLRWFINDVQYHEVDRRTEVWDVDPFDQPFHWILNVAVGGEFLPNPPAGATFREAMVVDYVRVYQDINQAPTIAIANLPERLTPGVEYPFELLAQDPDGQVDSVRLVVNGTPVATVRQAPFVVNWAAPVDGCYHISAEVFDNDGLSAATRAELISAGEGCVRRPFSGSPAVLPATIPFVNFDYGGPGVGYDWAGAPVASNGPLRPTEGVPHADRNGQVWVTNTRINDRLYYTVTVPETGSYDLTVTVRPPRASSRIAFTWNGNTVAQFIRFTSGEDGTSTRTLEGITLEAGTRVLGVQVETDGFELLSFSLVRTGTTSAETEAAPVLELGSIFPSPVRDAFQIPLSLMVPQHVSVRVHDMLGREVARLYDALLPAGSHVLPATVHLPAGTYFVHIATEQAHATRALVVSP